MQAITAKIRTYAKEHGLTYDKALTLFFLERAAIRLSNSEALSSKIVFKGGFVNVRVYQSPRHTTDLDAVIKGLSHELTESIIIEAVSKNIEDGVWYQHQETSKLVTQNDKGGLRILFRSGLGEKPENIQRSQKVHIDIGSDSPENPKPIETETPLTIGRGSISWSVYPVELTVAEKLHAIVSRGGANSRSKDIFDLDLLMPMCSEKKLLVAIENTFSQRKTKKPKSICEFLSSINRDVLGIGWSSATAGIDLETSFDEVFENVIIKCKALGI